MGDWKSLSSGAKILLVSTATFFGSIAVISTGLSNIEPWLPAHRQFPRDLVAVQTEKIKHALEDHVAETKRIIAPTKIGMYDIQISIAQARRASINDQIFASEINAPKSDSPEELLKQRQRLQRLKDDLDDVEASIRLLRDQRERN